MALGATSINPSSPLSPADPTRTRRLLSATRAEAGGGSGGGGAATITAGTPGEGPRRGMYLRHPLTNPLFPAADPNPRVALRPRAPPPPRPFELEIIVRFQAYRYFFRGLAAGVASFIRWSRGSRVNQPSTTPAMAFWGERAGLFALFSLSRLLSVWRVMS